MEQTDFSPTVAIVLAAGLSRRMGEPKLLLPWGQTTILGQTLTNVLASSVDAVLLVTGFQRELIEAMAAARGVSTVHNADYATGEMLSSLQCGLRQLPDTTGAVLVVLGDQPLISGETIDLILAANRNGAGSLVAPSFGKRQGNPVLIARRHFSELLALPPGSAPQDLLRKHPQELILVPVESDSVLKDIDSPESYQRLRPKKKVG